MKKVKIVLWVLFYCWANQGKGQSIEEHYSFVKRCYEDSCYREDDPSFIIIKVDDIELRYKDKYNGEKIILYNSKTKTKIDSFNITSIYPERNLLINNSFYFFKFINKKNYLSKINFSDFSIKDSKINFLDSLSQKGNDYKNSFLLYDDNGDYKSHKNTFLKLYSYNPISNQLKFLYDFKSIKPNPYEGLPFNPGISSIIEVKGKNKILVERAIWEGGKSGPAYYYILDLITLKVEEINDTKFSKLVEAPRKKFQSSPAYQVTVYCSPMYDYFYYDITDTLVYLNVDDYYGYFLNEKGDAKAGYAIYPQDAFVLNGDYEVIDQVLNRENRLEFYSGIIYEKNQKKAYVINIDTDSYGTYSINFAVKYPLEKAFYNIYYNKELSDKELQGFDQYELLLLKNFIYAKYNYKFKNPFYEAYYNTFTFYHNFQTWDAGKKKLERRKKVDKYFTKEDNKNLALILTKIK